MNAVRLAVCAFVFVAASEAQAEPCAVEGRTTTPDGRPVAEATVTFSRTGMFRSTVRQVTSTADGRFTVPNLPCGRYDVIAGTATTSVNTEKQRTVDIVVDEQHARSMARAMTAIKDFAAARGARAARALTEEEQRDLDAASAFLDTVAPALLTPDEHQRYQRSGSRDERTSLIVAEIAWRLAQDAGLNGRDRAREQSPAGNRGFESLNTFRRPPDSEAIKAQVAATDAAGADAAAEQRMIATRAFIARAFSEPQAAAFDVASRQQQIATLLKACRAALERQAWPTTMLLFFTQSNYGVTGKAMVREFLGDTSLEFRAWDDRLSPRWRGEAVRRAYAVLFTSALTVAEGRAGLEALGASMGVPVDAAREEATVRNALGGTAAATYRRLTDDARRQMLTEALLLQLGQQFAAMLEL